jgi:hypothetical protein
MTYHGRELLVSQSPQYSQRRAFNNGNNRWFPSRLSPTQSLRIECKAEERHFISDYSSPKANFSVKPIRYTMNDQFKPVKFRSEIIVHNNPETDLHIKRLRVAFHYHDDSPANALLMHRSSSPPPSSSIRSRSLNIPRSSLEQQQQKDNNAKQRFRHGSSSQSQTVLHQWIDDICANEQLMANDDIVFFIKNGEFFARI